MKKNTYITDRTRYGGRLYASDFDTSYPNGRITERIIIDGKFDEQCKKNTANRQNRPAE